MQESKQLCRTCRACQSIRTYRCIVDRFIIDMRLAVLHDCIVFVQSKGGTEAYMALQWSAFWILRLDE